MKKNIFAVLLLGFLFSLSFAAEELDENMIKCDDPKVLALVEKEAQRELHNSSDSYFIKANVERLSNGVYLTAFNIYKKDIDDIILIKYSFENY